MASQTSTRHVSCHKKLGTTPVLPTPVNHPRKQQHHHQHHHHHDVQSDLAAMSLSMSPSSQVQADSSSQFPTRTSSSSDSYTELTSCPASLSGLPTLAKLEPSRTSPPKSSLDCEISSSSSSPSAKPAFQEAQTNQGPPCNNCHQPSTPCTVGPLNPKGNAGRKYFACKRCPYGLAWVGWAGEFFDVVVVAVKDEGVDPTKGDRGDGPDSVHSDAGFARGASHADGRQGSGSKEPEASGQGSLVTTLERGKKWGISISPHGSLSEEEADDSPRCCCGEAMKLDYVDVSWDGDLYSLGAKTLMKKWFWTCTYGACGEFIWVGDTGGDGLAHHGGCRSEKRMGASVRILW